MEKRVQEIRELEKQATPGPWKQEYDILCLKESKALCYTMAGFASDDDWKLVQALRNNILAILDDNERLRAEDAQLQRERDALQRALAWAWFALVNDDPDFPHGYADRAMKMAEEQLGPWGECMPTLLKDGPQEVEHG